MAAEETRRPFEGHQAPEAAGDSDVPSFETLVQSRIVCACVSYLRAAGVPCSAAVCADVVETHHLYAYEFLSEDPSPSSFVARLLGALENAMPSARGGA